MTVSRGEQIQHCANKALRLAREIESPPTSPGEMLTMVGHIITEASDQILPVRQQLIVDTCRAAESVEGAVRMYWRSYE